MCQGEGTMDDDFLTQAGGNDLEAAPKWREDILLDEATDRVEPL